MFAEHQLWIAQHAMIPQGFADVVTFVIATQNQHFYRVGSIIDTLRTDGLDAAKQLTGAQKRGIAHIHNHAAYYVNSLRGLEHGYLDALATFKLLLEIPQIGIVKAGFITQLALGKFGCLDRHNLKMLGLDIHTFQRVPTSTEALTQRLTVYMHTCHALGSSAQLYDNWCRLIALKYPQHFMDAEDVSYHHALWCNAI